MLEKNGFKKVSVVPFDFLHPCAPKFLVKAIERVGLILEKTLLIKEIAGSLFIVGTKWKFILLTLLPVKG